MVDAKPMPDVLASIKKAYFFFEDKYYGLLDKIDSIVPVYKIVDPVDKIVPSFVLSLLVFVLLFSGLAVLIANPDIINGLFGLGFTARIQLLDDDGNPLPDFQVSLIIDGNTQNFVTDANGFIELQLKEKSIGHIVIDVEGFEKVDRDIELFAGERSVTVKRITGPPEFLGPFNISVVEDESGANISDVEVTASFSCFSGISGPSAITNNKGFFSLSAPKGCGTLFASFIASGYNPRNNVSLSTEEIEVRLSKINIETIVKVSVRDTDGNVVANAVVVFLDPAGVIDYENVTDASGLVLFEDIEAGDYNVIATAEDGRQSNKEITVEVGETLPITITLVAPVPVELGKKVFLKIIDSNSSEPIMGASVTVYADRLPFKVDVKSDAQGLVSVRVSPEQLGKSFSAVIVHPSYVLKIVNPVIVIDASVMEPEEISLDRADEENPNYGSLQVMVLDETGKVVTGALVNALVSLFSTDYSNPLYSRPSLTNTEGIVVFTNLPPGTYKAYAQETNFDEQFSQIIQVDANKTTTVTIILILGRGGFKAIVKDLAGVSVAGALVEFVNIVDGNVLDANTTNSSGIYFSKPLKVSKMVFARVTANGFLKKIEPSEIVVTDVNKELNILLYRPSEIEQDKNLSIKFLGLFKTDSAQSAVVKILAGTTYLAKFALILANSVSFTDIKAHVRAGLDSQENSADTNIFVQDIIAPGLPNIKTIKFSKRFDSENIFSISVSDSVSSDSNAKLANAGWTALEKGVYDFTVKVATRKNAPDGADVDLRFVPAAIADGISLVGDEKAVRYKIGQNICTANCNAFDWLFTLQHGSEKTSLDPARVQGLKTGYDYNLFYTIYNLSSKNYNVALDLNNNPAGILEFKDHSNDQNFRVFPDQSQEPIPFSAGQVASMKQPIGFNSIIEAAFTSIDLNLFTDPVLAAIDKTNFVSLDFAVVADNNLSVEISPIVLPKNPISMELTVRNKQTNAVITEHVTVRAMVDGIVGAPGTMPFTNLSSPTGKYIIAFASGFMPTNFVNIVVSAPNYAPFKQTVFVTGEDIPFVSNFDYSCITVDANPDTMGIDENIFINRPAVSTTPNVRIKVSANNCPYRTDVSISPPGYLMGDFDSVLPAILETSGSKIFNLKVHSTVPQGKIPIYVNAKFSEDYIPRRLNGASIIVSDPNSCFAMTGNSTASISTITETTTENFTVGTIDSGIDISNNEIKLLFKQGAKLVDLKNGCFAVPGTDNVYIFKYNDSTTAVMKVPISGVLPQSSMVGEKGYFAVLANDKVWSGRSNDTTCDSTVPASNNATGVKYNSSLAIATQTKGTDTNVFFAALGTMNNPSDGGKAFVWQANKASFGIISSLEEIKADSVLASNAGYFFVVGNSKAYSWDANKAANKQNYAPQSYDTTGTTSDSKIAFSQSNFAVPANNNIVFVINAANPNAATNNVPKTFEGVNASSNIVSSSTNTAGYFFVAALAHTYSIKSDASQSHDFATPNTIQTSNIVAEFVEQVAIDKFYVIGTDETYAGYDVRETNALPLRKYATVGTLPSSNISASNGYFGVLVNGEIYSAGTLWDPTHATFGLKKHNATGVVSNSNIVVVPYGNQNSYFFVVGDSKSYVWQNNGVNNHFYSLSTPKTKSSSSIAVNGLYSVSTIADGNSTDGNVFIMTNIVNAPSTVKAVPIPKASVDSELYSVSGKTDRILVSTVGEVNSVNVGTVNATNPANLVFTGLEIETAGYPQSGKYTTKNYSIQNSSDFGTNQQVSINSVSWTASQPAGTNIIAQYSKDNSASWNTVSNGASLYLPVSQFKLRFTLSTTNKNSTPKLDEIKIKYSQNLAENSNDKFVYNISKPQDFTDSGTITNKCYKFVQDYDLPSMEILGGIEPSAVSLRYYPEPKAAPIDLTEIYEFPSYCEKKNSQGTMVECSGSFTTDTFVSDVDIDDCNAYSNAHNYQDDNFSTAKRLVDKQQTIILLKKECITTTDPKTGKVTSTCSDISCMNDTFNNYALIKFNTAQLPVKQKTVRLRLYSGNADDGTSTHNVFVPQTVWNQAVTWNTMPGDPNDGTPIGTLNFIENGWWEIDITDLYNSWVDGSEPNNGLYIVSTDKLPDLTTNSFATVYSDSASNFSFYSSETIKANRPKLLFGTEPLDDIDNSGIVDFNVSNSRSHSLVGENNYALIRARDYSNQSTSDVTVDDWFNVQLVAPKQENCVLPDNTYGKTGSVALPRIKLDWSWNGNELLQGTSSGICDQNNNPDYVYCDATQFSIMLIKKLEAIKTKALQADYDAIAPFLHFNSYLMRDGYGTDFRKDFDYYAHNVPFFDVPAIYKGGQESWDKYFPDETLMTFNSSGFDNSPGLDGKKVLTESGLYRVDLSFVFPTNQKWDFFDLTNNNAPNANINVQLTLLNKPSVSSPFYSMPFDGAIGTMKRTLETIISRDGYGLGFSADGEKLHIVNNGGNIVDADAIAGGLKTFTVSTTKPTQLSFNKLNSESPRGVLLSIDFEKSKINFSPNYATPVIMEIASSETDKNIAGYYSIWQTTDSAHNIVQQLKFDKYGSVWTGIGSTKTDCTDFSGNKLFSSTPDRNAYSLGELCTERLAAQGFNWKNVQPNENQLFLRTIFYAPASPDQPFFLKRACGKQTAFASPNHTIPIGDDTKQLSLDYTYAETGMNIDIGSIKDIFDQVYYASNQGENVCVSATDTNISFWWNPQAIEKKLSENPDIVLPNNGC